MFKIFSVLLVFLILSVNSFSAVRIWNGGGVDNNWQTAKNWKNNTAPKPDDDLIFPTDAARFASNNDFPLFSTFNTIKIEGGNYLIGGNPFCLTNGLFSNGGQSFINTLVSLLSPQEFAVGKDSVLTVANVDFDSFDLRTNGSGSLKFGLISGRGNIEKNGSGSTLISGAANYSSGITVNNGTLIIDADISNSPILVNTRDENTDSSRLFGTGKVSSVHIIKGGVSAGTPASPNGILQTDGDFDVKEGGTVAVKIGGTNAGKNGYDQFKVNGLVFLENPTLSLILTADYQIKPNDSFVIIDNDGNEPINGIFKDAPEGAIIGGGFNRALTISYVGGNGNDVVLRAVNRAKLDFDGDGKSDISNFRPSDGTWNIFQSTTSKLRTQQFGIAGDIITPADFDGDAITDFAVYRPSSGIWYILNSADYSIRILQFGLDGDIPTPNDFDGDGRADIGVFRPSDGVWYQIKSADNQFSAQKFGQLGDLPQIVDFDGDGLGDLSVFRPADGVWHFLLSKTQQYTAFPFGLGNDVPVPADYDGDGKTDVAVFRANNNLNEPDFYILFTKDFSYTAVSWGLPGDKPVIADYDGDSKADIAVFRPDSNDWYILQSTNGFAQMKFGQFNDKPVSGF